MFSGNIDVDVLILSYVEDLNNIPKNKYVNNIFNDQNFWKIRFNHGFNHEYTHKNIIDYKSIVQLLDDSFYSLDDKYFLSNVEISKQLSNIFKHDNPLYLLTSVNIEIGYLMSYTGQSYIKFINTVIKWYVLELRGFENIVSDKLTYNRNSVSKLKDYFDETVYSKNTISIKINTTSGYRIIELYNKSGFTNGELIYKFSKALPLDIIIDTENIPVFFDGLYYDNGIYDMLTYTNRLIDIDLNSKDLNSKD